MLHRPGCRPIRLAPTADDIARTAGTGLAAVGQVTYVKDQYQNLNPQDVRGLDVSLNWRLHGTRFGDFDADINVAHFNKFYRQPSAEIAELLAARQAGKINAGTSITGGGDLLRQNGTPKTKVSASLTWRYEQLTVGAFTKYISSMDDTSLLAADGTPYCIEANPNPEIAQIEEFAQAAKHDGLPYAELLNRVVALGISRAKTVAD